MSERNQNDGGSEKLKHFVSDAPFDPYSTDALTPEQARNQAINALAAVNNGEDPAGARDAARNAPTMEDLGRRVIRDHAAYHCKPRTVVGYRYYLKAYINPHIGTLKVRDILRSDIAKFHHDLRYTPVQANRCMQLLSKMFNLAELWGYDRTARIPAATFRSTRRRNESATSQRRNWPGSARSCANANRKASRASRPSTPSAC